MVIATSRRLKTAKQVSPARTIPIAVNTIVFRYFLLFGPAICFLLRHFSRHFVSIVVTQERQELHKFKENILPAVTGVGTPRPHYQKLLETGRPHPGLTHWRKVQSITAHSISR